MTLERYIEGTSCIVVVIWAVVILAIPSKKSLEDAGLFGYAVAVAVASVATEVLLYGLWLLFLAK